MSFGTLRQQGLGFSWKKLTRQHPCASAVGAGWGLRWVPGGSGRAMSRAVPGAEPARLLGTSSNDFYFFCTALISRNGLAECDFSRLKV